MNNLRAVYKILNISNAIITRHVQSNASILENIQRVTNRNPRNLELMRIARKPMGYKLEANRNTYYNILQIAKTGRHIEVYLLNHESGPIISVSTKEWALKNQTRKINVLTYTSMGKLLGQRCLEAGIASVHCNFDPNSERMNALINGLKESGLILREAPQYIHTYGNSWRYHGLLKPWTVVV